MGYSKNPPQTLLFSYRATTCFHRERYAVTIVAGDILFVSVGGKGDIGRLGQNKFQGYQIPDTNTITQPAMLLLPEDSLLDRWILVDIRCPRLWFLFGYPISEKLWWKHSPRYHKGQLSVWKENDS